MRARMSLAAGAMPLARQTPAAVAHRRRASSAAVSRAARLRVAAKFKVSAAGAGGDTGGDAEAGRGKGWKGEASKMWGKVKEAPWDDPARDWNKFLNVKTAGTIVDADLDNETITATPLKCQPETSPLPMFSSRVGWVHAHALVIAARRNPAQPKL
jgi:hypothetical protein